MVDKRKSIETLLNELFALLKKEESDEKAALEKGQTIPRSKWLEHLKIVGSYVKVIRNKVQKRPSNKINKR